MDAVDRERPAARFHTDQPTGDDLPLRLPTQLGSWTPAPPLRPLELELTVPACGSLGPAASCGWDGAHAGTRVRLWIDHQVIHLSADGQLLKTVASRFTSAELPWLHQLGARPASPPPATTPAGALGIPTPSSVTGWSTPPG